MIDISQDYLKVVRAILSKNVPDYEVWVFGSRVGKAPKKHSDLDLVIKTEFPLPVKTIALLRDAFSESNLPFRVDIVDWSRISNDFKKIISEKFEVIWKKSDTQDS